MENNSHLSLEEEIQRNMQREKRDWHKWLICSMGSLALLMGWYAYATNKEKTEKITHASKQCQQVNQLELDLIRETPLGRYSCREVYDFKQHPEKYRLPNNY